MIKITTHSIEISVKVEYWPQQSNPLQNNYFFIYFITIQNKGQFAVQLLKRHWDITDSNGDYRQVDGDGVVGETPIIEPNESFSYNSGCNLQTEIGQMQGYYTMQKLINNSFIQAQIPKFDLIVPHKLN
jgi:ApaG protein